MKNKAALFLGAIFLAAPLAGCGGTQSPDAVVVYVEYNGALARMTARWKRR